MLHGFESVISGIGERLCFQGFELLILPRVWGDCTSSKYSFGRDDERGAVGCLHTTDLAYVSNNHMRSKSSCPFYIQGLRADIHSGHPSPKPSLQTGPRISIWGGCREWVGKGEGGGRRTLLQPLAYIIKLIKSQSEFLASILKVYIYIYIFKIGYVLIVIKISHRNIPRRK